MLLLQRFNFQKPIHRSPALAVPFKIYSDFFCNSVKIQLAILDIWYQNPAKNKVRHLNFNKIKPKLATITNKFFF